MVVPVVDAEVQTRGDLSRRATYVGLGRGFQVLLGGDNSAGVYASVPFWAGGVAAKQSETVPGGPPARNSQFGNMEK